MSDNYLSDAYDYVKDKAVSTVKDLAAKGTTTKYTGPPKGRSANLDIGKMAEETRDRERPKFAGKKRSTKSTPKR